MIVFNLKKLEDFMLFLPKKITDEVYFFIDEDTKHSEFPSRDELKIVLHFLGKVTENTMGLYQTCLTLPRSLTEEKIFLEMSKVFEEKSEIKLIPGRITELVYSVS